MFKKLRNKFLILNMTLISVLLITAFGMVLAFSISNADRELDSRLQMNIFGAGEEFHPGGMQGLRNLHPNMQDDAEPPENRPEPIENVSLRLDKDGNILEVRSRIEYEDEFYESVISGAMTEEVGSAPVSRMIKTDNGYYKYRIFASENDLGERVYYMNMTNADAQIKMLENLALTLFIVLIAALALVFLICLFFANRAIRPIQEAWDKQNQFIADASHELKTPLAAINTNIDVLLAHGDSTINQEKKWLSYIKDESSRMAELTGDLLSLARLDAGGAEKVMLTEVSFSRAVESVILANEAVIFEKNLKFTESVEEGIMIRGDESRIKQLTLILLDNAMKYVSERGEIRLELKSENGRARLIVSNSFSGELETDKVFDRFYRSDQSRTRSSGGYGLGLAIAKSITDLHGGTIRLKNRDGAAEFIVEIPVAD